MAVNEPSGMRMKRPSPSTPAWDLSGFDGRCATNRHDAFDLNPNLTEIAMLTPILTVKTSAASTPAAAVVETATPKERTHVEPVRISGSQSEAVLKILETLNRHVVGSEPLPKEALIRLLDTLAKVLKFPPLPQETLRDFTRRLAVFLETLPPAARLALEKQLGQRNLAISIRILAEALKGPSIIDAPHLAEKFTPAAVARPATTQPEGRLAGTGTMPQGIGPQGIGPGRSTALPVAHALSASATGADPGLLQAALRKAFGDEEELAVAETGESEEQAAKSQTPRSDTAAAGTQAQAKANSETIPLLRAAAAFLAADSEALSLVAAIATGDIDHQTKADLERELGFDLSEQTGQIETPERPIETGSDATEQEPAAGPAAGESSAFSDTGSVSRQAASAAADPLPATVAEPEVRAKIASPGDMLPHRGEVEGFKGHDLGEWELHAEPEPRSFAPAAEGQSAEFEFETLRSEKTLVETLKTLVDASLSSPEGSAETAPDTLFATLAGETADMGAEALFAELQTEDDVQLPPDTAPTTGGLAEQAEPPGLEADTWSALLDAAEEKAARRPAHASGPHEGAQEAQMPRQPETAIARDAIPFAMIPYLPAKTAETRSLEAAEERPSLADDEQRDERGEGDDQAPEDEGPEDEESAGDEDETETADAYDLYQRMGGLG